MSSGQSASRYAAAQVLAARNDPDARTALLIGASATPGRRHRPYWRAAVSFMRWQTRRGLLPGSDGAVGRSPWWGLVNDDLLRDMCEAAAIARGADGGRSRAAARWLEFLDRPSAAGWYDAHNGSIAAAVANHEDLARGADPDERRHMNLALVRVLYAHALVAAPQSALGGVDLIARKVGDPRRGAAGVFLAFDRWGRDGRDTDRRREGFVDRRLILPRAGLLFSWSADRLAEPRLLGFERDGRLVYAEPSPEWTPAADADHAVRPAAGVAVTA